mmetsp:Transcript_28684/g.66551  ORF Transcript_28684/g.66551 Transcript_28684/m.66551 type:complete len:138 (+) Transcript_28684:84-497(+)|eukprot:CAMPEP_0178420826 /NCGR_PEP_ID=MMETSP0689_2-20121128/26330_1 /TAXON_ID=160604 /ORGANISM="Amphidinium massartii, Strain CS-259" /LENGTH=137 /DNA_ID=CAMNT_0020042315 /DNA_START=14 /DNA_END=427 /DNA_ORIENTATION=+
MAASPEPSKVGKVQEDLNAAMSTMQGNMQQMVERDAQLNKLQDQSSALEKSSGAFKKQAKGLKQHQYWQQYKFWLVLLELLAIVVLVVLIIVLKDNAGVVIGLIVAFIALHVILYLVFRWYSTRLQHSQSFDNLNSS